VFEHRGLFGSLNSYRVLQFDTFKIPASDTSVNRLPFGNLNRSISIMTNERSQIITPEDVAREYGIPVATQRVWKCHNRHGWADLTIKVGRSSRYRRADIEAWLQARKGV
jgi:hypothetical protein